MLDSEIPEGEGAEALDNSGKDIYGEIVSAITALDGTQADIRDDQDPIVARVVGELRKKYPNTPEDALFTKARDLYWTWKDAERKKEKTGLEEFHDSSPM